MPDRPNYRISVTGTSESTTYKAGEVVTSGRMSTMSSNTVTPEISTNTQIPVINSTAWLTSSAAGEILSSSNFQALPEGYLISFVILF